MCISGRGDKAKTVDLGIFDIFENKRMIPCTTVHEYYSRYCSQKTWPDRNWSMHVLHLLLGDSPNLADSSDYLIVVQLLFV